MKQELPEYARSCAKVILCGEHFVLHGAPAVAVPLPDLTLTLEPATNPSMDPVLVRAWNTARSAAGLFEVENVSFEIRSEIPRGVGLGSSAALAVAFAKAAAFEVGTVLNESEMTAIATRVEDVFHGSSSGLDPAVIIAGRPVLRLGDGTIRKLSWGLEGIGMLVARVPAEGSTAQAVARTRAFATTEPDRFGLLLDEACILADRLADAIEGRVPACERVAGEVLSRFHRMLAETGVSCRSLDAMVEAAEEAGALGAKLTGAGLGGCVLALAPDSGIDRVEKAMISAGALDVFRV